jgi:hypothetical protein
MHIKKHSKKNKKHSKINIKNKKIWGGMTEEEKKKKQEQEQELMDEIKFFVIFAISVGTQVAALTAIDHLFPNLHNKFGDLLTLLLKVVRISFDIPQAAFGDTFNIINSVFAGFVSSFSYLYINCPGLVFITTGYIARPYVDFAASRGYDVFVSVADVNLIFNSDIFINGIAYFILRMYISGSKIPSTIAELLEVSKRCFNKTITQCSIPEEVKKIALEDEKIETLVENENEEEVKNIINIINVPAIKKSINDFNKMLKTKYETLEQQQELFDNLQKFKEAQVSHESSKRTTTFMGIVPNHPDTSGRVRKTLSLHSSHYTPYPNPKKNPKKSDSSHSDGTARKGGTKKNVTKIHKKTRKH